MEHTLRTYDVSQRTLHLPQGNQSLGDFECVDDGREGSVILGINLTQPQCPDIWSNINLGASLRVSFMCA